MFIQPFGCQTNKMRLYVLMCLTAGQPTLLPLIHIVAIHETRWISVIDAGETLCRSLFRVYT